MQEKVKKFENENFVVSWNTESDKKLANDIFDKLNMKAQEISNFFGLKTLPKKVPVKLYDDYDEFKNYVTKAMGSCENFVRGYAGNGEINMLNVEMCRTKTTHINAIEKDICLGVVHELAHIYHDFYVEQKGNKNCPIFICEGIATQLGEQRYYQRDKILCKASDLLANFYNKKGNYANAYTLMGYMMQKYPHNELLDILSWNTPLSEDKLDAMIVEANEYLAEQQSNNNVNSNV